MNYEIKNMDLHLMYRNRACPVLRRRSRSIVWPGRAVAVPEIPFKPYDATVRDAFRQADAANKRVKDFINELNRQWKDPYEDAYIPDGLTRGKSEFEGIRDVVQHKFRRSGLQEARSSHTDKRRVPDGKRDATGRQRNDVRPVENEQAQQTLKARWENCENYKCPDNASHNRCMDRQRAGTCPTQSGSDMRSDTSRVQSPGRKPA